MEIGTITKTVVSKTEKKKINNRRLQEVIYKTYLGKHKGKPYYSSQTRHEVI